MFYFIVDPSGHDGQGERIWRRIQRRLGRLLSAEGHEVFIAEKDGDAREFARKVTERDGEQKVLVVVGEDATLNEVVDGSRLDTDDVSLAFISSGKEKEALPRLPHRKHGWKRHLKNILGGGETLRLDYGILDLSEGHRRFVRHAGVGFEGAFLQKRLFLGRYAPEGKPFFLFRHARYVFLFLRSLFRMERCRGYVVLDDEKRLEFNHLCFVSAFLRPFEASSGAAGQLDLCIVSTRRRLRLLRILFSTMRGGHKDLAGASYYQCSRALVHLEEPMPAYADGAYCGKQQDIRLHCVPRKLRMLI